MAPPNVPKLVDLTYAFDDKTIYWSAHEKFQHIQVSFGKTPAGYFYSSYNFAGSEHGGTHMDAPIHFSEGKMPVDQIPIERRAQAFKANDGGWTHQSKLVEKYLERPM